MSKKASKFTFWSDLRFLLRKSRRLLKAYLKSFFNPATYKKLGQTIKADSLNDSSLNQQALDRKTSRERFNLISSGGNRYTPIGKKR
ncbi:hypothetical protein CBW52_18830 [Yersinia kristensenii]|uniref:Uncharacterized protein n=2 Tax=Yersinia TaxID=629 RepID=B0RKX8_YEREN|nr:hypothetical protein [Yersinia massiliensis]ALG47325.1 hypothetical protein LI89_22155 [Yersinia enterocolitica]OVZ78403.1 hypothetical protein CBW52_18830 [Yersinia kristensenii]OWF75360.1 hypothetical protein B4903_20635 [Yersinia frederiksenii]EKN5934649.1 hypothetical protein [Yersinia enterocolitica]CAP20227.1 hypothetical protein [Yersinia enterocolitica]